jgi:hypothetical protein
MFNKSIISKALRRSTTTLKGQDSLVSLIIHDIFGGEILKTWSKKNWHFYNRIDGERVDFTKKGSSFEDIPSTPDETYAYVDQADYLVFLTRFVRAFEETVGLNNYRPDAKAGI